MKIIELLASRHFTGPAESIMNVMNALVSRGHEVLFAHTQEPPGTLADKIEKLPVRYLKDVGLKRKGFILPGIHRDVARLSALVSGDEKIICHVHTSHDHWVGRALNKRFPGQVFLVRSVHEMRIAQKRLGDVPLFRASDGCVVISDEMRSRLADAYSIEPSRIAVVRGSVDTDFYRPDLDPSAIFKETGVSSKDRVVGIVSRIKAGRGHEVLLRSFSSILKDFADAVLFVVGRGEGQPEIENLAAKLNLTDHVRFLGYRRDDLPQIYNAMRVKVLLGEGSDGTCRAVLEAMSCGTPVIAARVGALTETVEDGKTGTLIDGSVESLGAALREYFADFETAEQRGRNARNAVLHRFTVDKMTQDTESFFESLLNGN